MPETDDWNAQVIAEFRENGGKVGGMFRGLAAADPAQHRCQER